MNLRHSIMIDMLGRVADRFHEYGPAKNLHQQLELAAAVQGIDGIEIAYPTHFTNIEETTALVRETGLPVSALNLDVKRHMKWREGSFTSPNPQVRRDAVDDLKTALDLAAELGTDMVTCCPLIDGHNYNFEVDFLTQWQWLEEGIATGARHRSDVRLSLEFKQSESRNYNILANAGRALYLCDRIGLPHVGITLDVGHALMAQEAPAEVLCLLARAGRMFYLHFNDNDRRWDWDMLPGSVNFWDLVEVVFYLDRLDWEGWVSYDVVTRNGDLVGGMEASIELVEGTIQLLDRFGREELHGLVNEGVPARTFRHLMRSLL